MRSLGHHKLLYFYPHQLYFWSSQLAEKSRFLLAFFKISTKWSLISKWIVSVYSNFELSESSSALRNLQNQRITEFRKRLLCMHFFCWASDYFESCTEQVRILRLLTFTSFCWNHRNKHAFCIATNLHEDCFGLNHGHLSRQFSFGCPCLVKKLHITGLWDSFNHIGIGLIQFDCWEKAQFPMFL